MNQIGRTLADAVPPLPEPADRIGEIRVRVRRARIRAAAAGCAVVAVLAGLALAWSLRPVDDPAPVATRLDSASCPAFAERGELPADPDRAGPLVPAGATEVMLCEVNRAERLIGARVLRTGATGVVDVLNALPTRDRLRGYTDGAEWLGNPGGGCNLANYYEQLSLVLRYPDGTTVTVFYDMNCNQSVVPGGALRYGNAICEFRRLYRENVNAIAPLPQPWPPCD
jgi:hypothetical protein